MRPTRVLIVLMLSLLLITPALASPDPDDEGVISPLEAAPSHDHQHGGKKGHLPPTRKNVRLVGKLDLFGKDEQPGRIADVAAFGKFAYLGQWGGEPTGDPAAECRSGGVYVVNIADPSKPKEVAFIPASPNTYVGEGVQVFKMNTEFFKGPVLVHNNENCPVGGAVAAGAGGASLWDVKKPRSPQPLAEHIGDNDPGGSVPHQSHSAFGWQQGKRAYLVMVDNEESGTTDIDILDITNPAEPTLVLETGLDDFPQIEEVPAPNGSNASLHDMIVKRVDGRYLLLASYWDGGYLILDVTNLGKSDLPNKQRAKFLRDTDFGPVEPFRKRMDLPTGWTPEGNAHQAEFNQDNSLFLGADEDFGPRRPNVAIDSGPHKGSAGSATLGDNVPPVRSKNPIAGPTEFLGEACTPATPAPSANHIAVIERGTCTFSIKAQTAQRAGYRAGIVFNQQEPGTGEDCRGQVFMAATADIPFIFVGRDTGLKILQREFSDPCEESTPAPGTRSADVTLSSTFDGWGYLHLFDSRTMEDLDRWALPQALDGRYADGFGDLSIHEVATDPRRNLAYISHYSGGLRVVRFSRAGGIRQAGAFIAKGGNNFWGVEVHRLPKARKKTLILASDRDSGLWIFRYKP